MIGPLRSYQDVYVAVCGQQFVTHRAGIKHERECEDCKSGQKPYQDADICGFCGEPGADKMPHPVRWPGEQSAGTELVHTACEQEECGRAHAELTPHQRDEFLKTL